MNEAELWMHNPIFAAAGKDACTMLSRFYPADRHRPEEKLVTTGEPLSHLHVVLEGCVRVYHQNPDGLELTVKLLRAPVVYGDIEMFHALPFLENVAAVDDALIAKIPVGDYDKFLDDHPPAMKAHLRHLSAAFCVSAKNEQQLFASLERRVANLLLAYAQVQVEGKGPRLGDKPAVPLSQESIAQSLGVVRRSVAGVLGNWSKKGIVRKRGNYLVIDQPEVLEELCAPIANSLPYWIGMPMGILSGSEAPTDDRGACVELVEGPLDLVARRTLLDRELVLGRDPSCGLVFSDEAIALRHARLFRSARGGRYWVQALSTKLPTLLNDAPVTRAVLRDGDVVGLGAVRLRVQLRPG